MKVVTGIRRCGKSTLFELFIDDLKKIGVREDHIISLNLESPEYNFSDCMELYNYVNDKIIDDDMYYVFLDEVQVVDKLSMKLLGINFVENRYVPFPKEKLYYENYLK